LRRYRAVDQPRTTGAGGCGGGGGGAYIGCGGGGGGGGAGTGAQAASSDMETKTATSAVLRNCLLWANFSAMSDIRSPPRLRDWQDTSIEKRLTATNNADSSQ
jgi:hypothetical protein